MSAAVRRRWLAVAAAVVAAVVTLGAAPAVPVRVDDWGGYPPGVLDLGGIWRTYPFYQRPTFKHPPTIVVDDGRRVLQLMTEREAMRVGRPFAGGDVRQTPWLVWEWKPLVLPAGGDARDRRRNDQAARLMLVFEGMKAVAYLWDSGAPVGAEVQPDELEIFQRVLIVVRSGPAGLGQWTRERRNVIDDYRRAFGQEPGGLRWVGLESHSDDTKSRSATLWGVVSFEPR